MITFKKSIPFALSALALSVSQWACAVVPTSGAYVDDQLHRHSWVQDQVGDEISTVNMIMCVMSGLRGDAMVNQDPYGDGWMVKIELSDLSQVDGLLSAADYATSVGA